MYIFKLVDQSCRAQGTIGHRVGLVYIAVVHSDGGERPFEASCAAGVDIDVLTHHLEPSASPWG